MRLGDFLNTYPDFHFDVKEHLRSTKFSASLARSVNDFVRERSRRANVEDYAARIVASVNQGELRGVPAYRYLPRIDKVQDLPFLEKDDIRRNGMAYLSTNFTPEDLWVKKTTGSSGPPLTVFYNAECYFDFLLLSLQKVALTAGIAGDDRPFFCVAISGNQAYREYVSVDPSRPIGLFVQILVEENKPESFRRALRIIRALRPVCVSSKPTIYEILCSIVERELDPTSAPQILVSGGAEMAPYLREELERCLSGKVIDIYGMTEFGGVIASESDEGEMLIDTSSFSVEVLDEHGNAVPSGQVGELVISSLRNTAMPLLRYKTQDMGALDSTGTRLERFSGRKIQCFRLDDGALFSPTFFNDLFSRFAEVGEFQLIQKQISQFELLIDLKGGVASDPDLIQRVSAYIADSIPGRPTVSAQLGTRRTGEKFERFKTYCR
jgi:phenylacetate-CoA ligase